MPTFVHGKSTDFELDDTGGTSRSLSTVLTSVDFPEVIETAETTAFGATSKSYIVGLRDATISVSGLWDATVDGYIIGPYDLSSSLGVPGEFDNPDVVASLKKAHPAGRWAQPEEIAALMLFLASADANFMTGATIPIDGGFAAGKSI